MLLVARVNATAGTGPIGACGVAIAMLAMLTLLPALLTIAGRRAFWPFIPRADQGDHVPAERGFWRSLGERLARRPRPIWMVGVAMLAVLCAGLTQLDVGLPRSEQFRHQPGSLVAQAVLRTDPYGEQARQAIEQIRDRLGRAGAGDALVGGQTAQQHDLRSAAARDDLLIPPLVVAVVFAILALVLRALVLPLLLIASVVLSFGAALGAAAAAFTWAFGYPGFGPTLPVLIFIFLVALGTDYNIFLLARAREEAEERGAREGMLRALGATGAVITSAGIVLAGTFAALVVPPLVPLTEIGVAIAFGVLLDTFVVRSVLVPAAVLDAGRHVWWPWRLAHRQRTATPA